MYIVKVTHLVVNNVEKAQDSYKSRMAQKWGVPVVNTDFIHKCIEAGKLLEADPFVVVGKTATKEFDTGKIVGVYSFVVACIVKMVGILVCCVFSPFSNVCLCL